MAAAVCQLHKGWITFRPKHLFFLERTLWTRKMVWLTCLREPAESMIFQTHLCVLDHFSMTKVNSCIVLSLFCISWKSKGDIEKSRSFCYRYLCKNVINALLSG